jgi:hypothetical protein
VIGEAKLHRFMRGFGWDGLGFVSFRNSEHSKEDE